MCASPLEVPTDAGEGDDAEPGFRADIGAKGLGIGLQNIVIVTDDVLMIVGIDNVEEDRNFASRGVEMAVDATVKLPEDSDFTLKQRARHEFYLLCELISPINIYWQKLTIEIVRIKLPKKPFTTFSCAEHSI